MGGLGRNADRPGIKQGIVTKEKCPALGGPDLEVVHGRLTGVKASFIPAVNDFLYLPTAVLKSKC
jgi:hypothetical protein